jgi:hypothetical protein
MTFSTESVISTSVASGSSLKAKVFIPALLKDNFVLDNHSTDAGEIVRSKSARPGKLDRIEPELGGGASAFHVNVRGFRTFQAVEEETIGADV